jgi:hypothetical protein
MIAYLFFGAKIGAQLTKPLTDIANQPTGLPGLRGLHLRLDLMTGANGGGFRHGDAGAENAQGSEASSGWLVT